MAPAQPAYWPPDPDMTDSSATQAEGMIVSLDHEPGCLGWNSSHVAPTADEVERYLELDIGGSVEIERMSG